MTPPIDPDKHQTAIAAVWITLATAGIFSLLAVAWALYSIITLITRSLT